jgi:hypothetical protein
MLYETNGGSSTENINAKQPTLSSGSNIIKLSKLFVDCIGKITDTCQIYADVHMPGKNKGDTHIWSKSCSHTTSAAYKEHPGKGNIKILRDSTNFQLL